MNRKIEEHKKQREVAVYVAEAANNLERAALLIWTQGLLQIREARRTKMQKLVEMARLTEEYKVMWPIAKMMATKLREIVWDDRSTKMRVGMGVAAAAFAVFGSQGAGIAALGTAIGVPLWFVFGAGASFAWMLIEELQAKEPSKTKYTIDAEREEE
jgi:hypothetical protein